MNCDKITLDYTNSAAENKKLWKKLQQNELLDMQKRCWLHFKVDQVFELQSLYLFCNQDIISSNDHQIAVKVFKDLEKDKGQALVGLTTIPIENETKNTSQHQYNVSLLDPKTKKMMDEKQIDLNVRIFSHQNALEFMRYPTPNNEMEDSHQYDIVTYL